MRHTPTSTPAVALLLILSCLSAAGCTQRYAFEECTSDAQCSPFDDATTTYTCDVEAKECVGATRTPDASEDATDTPRDLPKDESTGCTSNAACIEQDGPGSLCGDDGTCFSALSQDCQSLKMPKNGETENIVIIGSLLPLIEPFGSVIGTPLTNAVEFATDRFNSEGGLPDGGRIAWLSCDTKGDAQISKRAAKHMTEVVGVPAILGPAFSENFIAVAADTAQPPNEAILFGTTTTSPAIDNLHVSPDDLVWRNISSDRFQGKAFLDRIASIGVQRVLILHKDDKYGQDLRTEIAPSLINSLGAANVKVAKYANPATFEDASDRRAAYGATVQDQLAGFEPQATLILGTSEGAEVAGAYFTITSALGRTPGKIIFSHGVTSAMAPLAQTLPEPVLPLIESVAPVIFDVTDQGYKNFALDYNIEFGGTDAAIVATTTFDAAMVVFLAMSTVPTTAQITPTSIAQGIARLIDQDAQEIQFFVTTNFASEARKALIQGNNVNLRGVSGDLDFDLDTGSIYSRYYGWEIREDPINGFIIVPKRIYTFSNPPELDGSWVELP